MSVLVLTPLKAQNTDRELWVDICYKTAKPVLYYTSLDSLSFYMEKVDSRPTCYLLEAVGRTICGVSSWLNLDDSLIISPDEKEKHRELFEYAERTLSNIVLEKKNDYVNFAEGSQNLVDAAYLCLGLHRSPRLWDALSQQTRELMIKELKKTRQYNCLESNWLLFASMVEAFLYEKTGTCDYSRLDRGLEHFIYAYYLGDGVYGDGYEYHNDYYNSYVIHPMLTEILLILGDVDDKYKMMWNLELERLRRWSGIQERTVAPDGSIPVVGRTITCRTGSFHGLATAVLYDVLPYSVTKGQVRSAMTAMLKKTMSSQDNYTSNGFLTMGFAGKQPSLAESYCCPASMYHCLTVFLPLGLPEESPFWMEEPADWTSVRIYNGEDIPADVYQEDRDLPQKAYQSLYRFWLLLSYKWHYLIITVISFITLLSLIGFYTIVKSIVVLYQDKKSRK